MDESRLKKYMYMQVVSAIVIVVAMLGVLMLLGII
jgi:hypothetical protein